MQDGRCSPPPTTRQIAAACGVNQSTVSHALNHHPKIPVATRDRIISTALKMGWKQNPLASAYMAHLRGTRSPQYKAGIGFLCSSPAGAQQGDLPLYMQRHCQGASERAAELGYHLESFWLHEPGLTSARLARILQCRHFPAVIVPGIIHPPQALGDFPWQDFAAVALGYSLMRPELHRVATHTFHGFGLALQKMLELGYKRLAVIISRTYDERVDHGVLYPAYYMKEQLARDSSRRGRSLEILTLPAASPAEMETIRTWLLRKRPEVVLGEEVVWQAIQSLGWQVPGDVAYVSSDWAPEYPGIGGFNQRHEVHGAMAVDLVVAQLLQNQRGLPRIPKFQMVEGAWADGASVPPVRPLPVRRLPARARGR